MNNNRLHEALYLFAYTLLVLLAVSILPPLTIGGTTLREVSLFSDIRMDPPKPEPVAEDSIAPPAPPKPGDLPCPPGVTCIEDYSQDGDALNIFNTALTQSGRQPVRIGFFGDSFIEGDILTASLRDTLQAIFGGHGPGLIPIKSEVARFRTTIGAEAENWTNYTIIGKYETEPVFGPAGFSTIPATGNSVLYRPGKNQYQLDPISLLYAGPNAAELRLTVNDTVETIRSLPAEPVLGSVALTRQGVSSLKIEVTSPDSINLYGISAERGNGVFVDNLAMRGNSGLALSRIRNSVLRKAAAIRPYKLIVLQYGLNVVTETDSTTYSWYAAGMSRVVEHIRAAVPDCSIMIVSVSDRAGNRNGNYQTLPGILAMRQAQRRVARNTGVAFWDLFKAMGGENSIIKFTEHQPPLAGKDYTHLNFRGGKIVAGKLAESLLFEQQRHEVRYPGQ
ncbi:MAG: GDSL-type esterase/lipase family protein [Bacteroidota bacterium]